MQLKNILDSKANELQVAEEDMERLKEMKTQNENYWKSAQKRFDHLQRSNALLKSQVGSLQKEKRKVVKNGKEQEEYFRQKIELYEEKLRKRCEKPSNNPKMREKQRRITEEYELNKMLRALNEEEKKYEKKLFRSNCNKKALTAGNKIYPFKNFVVNIAEIYLETKNIDVESEKVSREIEDIESRIESKRQQILLNQKMLSMKNSLDIVQNVHRNLNKEINIMQDNSDYSNVDVLEEDTIESELTMDVNFECNINAEKDNSTKCTKKFHTDFFNTSTDATRNSTGDKSSTLSAKDNDFATESGKKNSDETKARKWMERLKIFIPKFKIIPEENAKYLSGDNQDSGKSVIPANEKKIEEKSNLCLSSENLTAKQRHTNTQSTKNLEEFIAPLKASDINMSAQHQVSPAVKNVTLDNSTLKIHENSFLHQESLKNTSKYFRKIDEEVERMDFENEIPDGKKGATKYVIQELVKSKKSEDKGNIEDKIEKFLNKGTLRPDEPMDIDQQSNKREFESSLEKMSESETHEIVSKDGADIFLFQTSHVEETKRFIECNETTIHSSSVLNEGKIINKFENRILNSNESQIKVSNQHQDFTNIMLDTVTAMSVSDNVMTDSSKKPQLHHFLDTEIPQTPAVSKNDHLKNAKILHRSNEIPPKEIASKEITPKKITSKEMNAREDKCQPIPVTTSEIDIYISNKSPHSIPAKISSLSPVETSQKNFQSFNIPTDLNPKAPSLMKSNPTAPSLIDSNPKTPSFIDSNLKTPLTKQLRNSGESLADMNCSAFFPNTSNSPSPGFAFVTRKMFPTTEASSKNDHPETIPKDPQSNIFAQLAFFNNSPQNIPFTQIQSPDEDKSEFLSADYENYLTDSPPVIKGAEKSMFAFAEDSPENEGKNDFFPLFVADNGEANKDQGNQGAAFSFNFDSISQAQSPEENKSFKFLF